MNKTIALAWGLATTLPLLFMLFFMTIVMTETSSTGHDAFEEQFDLIFRLGMWANALILTLLVSFVVYLFTTDHVPKDKKALWAVVLFMGYAISMPILWYVYVWTPLESKVSPND